MHAMVAAFQVSRVHEGTDSIMHYSTNRLETLP